jgi:translation initiation factor 2 subunit 1
MMMKGPLMCHMYENELPDEGDLVVVKITKVEETGAHCKLLEYGEIDAMLPCTEYSRKRIKSVKKLVRPGKQDVLEVLKVDKVKNYIDLSKKHVTKEEVVKVSSNFHKSKFVHSLLKHIASSKQCKALNVTLTDLYQQIGWPLYKDYDHAFDGFEMASHDSSILSKYTIDNSIKDVLWKSLQHKFAPKPKTISAIVQVSCAGPRGINAIKEALSCGQNANNNDDNDKKYKIDISVVKCPEYSISCRGIEVEKISHMIKKSMNAIQQSIEAVEGGTFLIKEDIV